MYTFWIWRWSGQKNCLVVQQQLDGSGNVVLMNTDRRDLVLGDGDRHAALDMRRRCFFVHICWCDSEVGMVARQDPEDPMVAGSLAGKRAMVICPVGAVWESQDSPRARARYVCSPPGLTPDCGGPIRGRTKQVEERDGLKSAIDQRATASRRTEPSQVPTTTAFLTALESRHWTVPSKSIVIHESVKRLSPSRARCSIRGTPVIRTPRCLDLVRVVARTPEQLVL
jgi:hypothetical protein